MDVPIKSDGLIEFLASTQGSGTERDGHMTTSEISNALGVSEKKVRSVLRKLINDGRVTHKHVYVRSIDGNMVRSNGYRLITD
jgi:DNA-binding Lrp family transcriptional regulator